MYDRYDLAVPLCRGLGLKDGTNTEETYATWDDYSISASVLNLLGFARQLSSQPSYQRSWKEAEVVLRKLMRAF